MQDALIKRMIQIGVVSSIDAENLQARVIFRESGMVSAWLPVIQHTDEKMTKNGGHQHTTPHGTSSYEPDHTHTITTWMPKINDVVLVVYPCIQNSDGYIIGRIPS